MKTTTKTMIAALAEALTALGRPATADGEWLRVPSAPSLRTPEVRGDWYVWDGYRAKSPTTMAKRLDAFLKEIGK